ncbi:DUF429 domain-containing protein [Pseudarthrobacter sp. SL88]|uniref:DUF429 domain-containing protein n=1 Tax=Pseudarthrobacter sp. SL88 TaxID=2994666 RepID=UPI003FA34664
MDLAAATKKTAAAVIEWDLDSHGQGRATLAHLALDVDDQTIVELFGTSDMTGVDCPVGWPDALIPFLTGHLDNVAGPVLEHDGIAGRRLLAYRDTDRFCTARTGLIPLSVSADRLAHPAMRCAVIQAKIACPAWPPVPGWLRPAGRGLSGGFAQDLGPQRPRLQGPRQHGNRTARCAP